MLALEILARTESPINRRLIIKDLLLRQDSRHAACALTRRIFRYSFLIILALCDVVSRAFAPIRNMETSVNSKDDIEKYDNDLDGEIEEIEAPLRIIPGWIISWPRVFVVCRCSEACPET